MMLDAGSANDRADQLVVMAQRIIGLVETEVAAMRARKLDGAMANSAEKERLVHGWRLEVQRIKEQPALLAGLDPARKEQLKTVSLQLAQMLERHAAELAAMRSVTEGLVRSIAAEVAINERGPEGYGRNGQTGQRSPNRGGGVAVDAKA